MVINILSNRSEWTFYFLSSVQFNFTISENILADYPDKNIIIGSHGTAIGTIINYFDSNFDYPAFSKIQPLMPFVAKFNFSGDKVDYRIIACNSKN